MGRLLWYIEIYDEKLLVRIGKTSQNINCSISTSNYQRYIKFASHFFIFKDDKYDEIS